MFARARGDRNQNELLPVLCASKSSIQRPQRVSVTSVFSFFLTAQNTEKKSSRNSLARQPGATGVSGNSQSLLLVSPSYAKGTMLQPARMIFARLWRLNVGGRQYEATPKDFFLKERTGNVIENKGSSRTRAERSGNVYEKTGTYTHYQGI